MINAINGDKVYLRRTNILGVRYEPATVQSVEVTRHNIWYTVRTHRHGIIGTETVGRFELRNKDGSIWGAAAA